MLSAFWLLMRLLITWMVNHKPIVSFQLLWSFNGYLAFYFDKMLENFPSFLCRNSQFYCCWQIINNFFSIQIIHNIKNKKSGLSKYKIQYWDFDIIIMVGFFFSFLFNNHEEPADLFVLGSCRTVVILSQKCYNLNRE